MSSSQRGLTLIEVVVAAAIITVGLTAVAAGLQQALAAAEASRRQTTALFLAEHRLEQVKARALMDFDGVAAASFPLEDPVAGYPQYRRFVDVTPQPADMTHAVRVRVTVADRARAEGAVTLVTILARRR